VYEAAALAALAARTRGSLQFDTGDPMVILLGPGTSDMYVGVDYQVRPFDESLWHTLHSAGFRRIVFSSPSEPMYALDAHSAELAKAMTTGIPSAAASPHPARQTRRRAPDLQVGQGTLAGHDRDQPVTAPADAGEGHSTTTPAGGLAGHEQPGDRSLDPAVLGALGSCMRSRDIPTAVVILRAEQFLQFVGGQRSLAEQFAEWTQPSATFDNVCLMIFASRSVDSVTELARSLGLTALVSYLERQNSRRTARGVSEISEPNAAEVGRLVQVARLRHGLRIADWRELDRIVAALAAQQGVPAVTWLRRLRGLIRASEELSMQLLQARGWVESLPSGQSAWDQLCQLTGLAEVKEHVDRLRWRAEAEAKRRAVGLLREAGSLHLVFTGGPGTGKTTVARLIGELYREMGLLRRGHVHAPEAADLIGMYVGHTAVQTNRAVDAALDGVLFIDEAYRLSEQPGGFGQEAIDSLVTRMDNDRDRLVVVVAGYPAKMDAFLRSNPGLPRRFPRSNIIPFPDYEPDELCEILLRMLLERGLMLIPEAAELLRRVVAGLHASRDETFGNAGEMRNLAQELETSWARRVRAVISEPITPDDLPDAYRKYA
jgi:hypothetical protein